MILAIETKVNSRADTVAITNYSKILSKFIATVSEYKT